MSGDTKDKVRVVLDNVVGTLGELTITVFGFDCINACNLLPIGSDWGFSLTGSHSSCHALKSPTVTVLPAEGLKTKFEGFAFWCT